MNIANGRRFQMPRSWSNWSTSISKVMVLLERRRIEREKDLRDSERKFDEATKLADRDMAKLDPEPSKWQRSFGPAGEVPEETYFKSFDVKTDATTKKHISFSASGRSKEQDFVISDGKIKEDGTFSCTEAHKDKKINISGKVVFLSE